MLIDVFRIIVKENMFYYELSFISTHSTHRRLFERIAVA
jgi:hypothetical protein